MPLSDIDLIDSVLAQVRRAGDAGVAAFGIGGAGAPRIAGALRALEEQGEVRRVVVRGGHRYVAVASDPPPEPAPRPRVRVARHVSASDERVAAAIVDAIRVEAKSPRRVHGHVRRLGHEVTIGTIRHVAKHVLSIDTTKPEWALPADELEIHA